MKSPGHGIDKAQAAVMDRLLQDDSSESYRDGVRALYKVINFLAIIIFALTIGFLSLVRKGHPGDRYFAMSFDNKKMEMVALDTPSLNTQAMLSWVSQACTQILTFGFNDINERLAESEVYFTDVGRESFYRALHESYLIKTIMSELQIMTAIPSGTPTIIGEGFINGQRSWDVMVPIVMTIRAGNKSKSAFPYLAVTIVRVPTQKNPRGFGIEKWVMF